MRYISTFSLRLDKEQLTMIGEIIKKDPEKYESISHIFRIGLVKIHREEMKK